MPDGWGRMLDTATKRASGAANAAHTPHSHTADGYKIVSPSHVAGLLPQLGNVLLLDVRTPREWDCHRIPGSLLLPVQELAARVGELDPSRSTICICEHGIRSETAAEFLAHHGFHDVATMRGGLVRWHGPLLRGNAGDGEPCPPSK